MAGKHSVETTINDLLYVPLSGGGYGGYRLEILKQNLSPMEQTLVVCSCCKGVMREASFSSGRNTCLNCCPQNEQSAPVDSIREIVMKLPCRCPVDSEGCVWSGAIDQIETHLDSCEYNLVPCPFADYGCETGLIRRLEIPLHLKEFSAQHLLGRIMKVEEENKRAFRDIELLKKEVGFLKDQISRQKCDCDKGASALVANLRMTSGEKQLEGIQFIIADVKAKMLIEEIQLGPVFYSKRYKLQVLFKFDPHLRMYIQRIPGEYDEELEKAMVYFLVYQFVHNEDYHVLFEYDKCPKDLLAIDSMGYAFSEIRIDGYTSNDKLTIRIFLQIVEID